MNTHVKIPKLMKVAIILIPLVIFGYLIYNNFIIDQEFNYFYDIGGETDSVKPYLTPLNRTSDYFIERGISYRDVNHRLIYFNIPRTSGVVSIDFSILVNRATNNSFIGIKNNTGWNYTWYPLDLSESNLGFILSKSIPLEGAYFENNKLIVSLDLRDLKDLENQTYSIDWINITAYKPGVFS